MSFCCMVQKPIIRTMPFLLHGLKTQDKVNGYLSNSYLIINKVKFENLKILIICKYFTNS